MTPKRMGFGGRTKGRAKKQISCFLKRRRLKRLRMRADPPKRIKTVGKINNKNMNYLLSAFSQPLNPSKTPMTAFTTT